MARTSTAPAPRPGEEHPADDVTTLAAEQAVRAARGPLAGSGDSADLMSGDSADLIPGAIFDDLVPLIEQRFDTGHAAVHLEVPHRGLVEVTAVRPGDGAAGPQVRRLCADVVSGRVTLVRRSLSDAGRPGAEAPPVSTAGRQVRFFVGVPLLSAVGVVVGVLSIWDIRPHDPAPQDILALEQFGRHAAIVLQLHRAAFELDSERGVLATTGHLLEMIVEGAELSAVLHSLVLAAEAAIVGTWCSIHLLDGTRLRDGASPHLPEAYSRAVDGHEIGPLAGSCGTAAFTGRTVIVSDIATDPRWDGYREMALPHGLRACWSVPITGATGQVLGTFALYYGAVRAPRPDELKRLARWVNLAEVAISRARDITALRAAATLDSLTGLMNRNAVLSRIEKAVARPDRSPAVLFVDLDQFKFVNDTLGHAAGDQFLKIVARRLTDCAGPDDTVARFGGDEFLILSPDRRPDEAESMARKIITALRGPMLISGRTLSLSASVGIAVRSAVERSEDVDLVSDADLAMYAAKRTGRNSVAVFAPQLRAEAADRLSLEADLDLALTNGELQCVYQPSVDMSDGTILGVEALVRWHSPIRGDVPPLQFVPVAEDSGVVGAVGQFVLERSCEQLAAWRALSADWRDVVMWVNVSPRQLRDPSFAASVEAVLARHRLLPASLGLEVTEGTFIDDSEAVQRTLLNLRGRGVHVAIDDFGTGYSSLAQLEHLPVDLLKIDRQFTEQIAAGGARSGLVAAIVTLAQTMGLRVVAEGVETVAQRDLLISLGCRYGQGYLWSAPLDAGGFDLSLSQFADVGSWTAGRAESDHNR